MASMQIVRRAPAAAGQWPEHVPALLQRIYAARGAHDLASAQPRLAQLLPPQQLQGIDAAVALLADAIAGDKRILVVGDFDCDGATATRSSSTLRSGPLPSAKAPLLRSCARSASST